MNENKEINDVIYMLKIRFSISEITKMTLCFFFIDIHVFKQLSLILLFIFPNNIKIYFTFNNKSLVYIKHFLFNFLLKLLI